MHSGRNMVAPLVDSCGEIPANLSKRPLCLKHQRDPWSSERRPLRDGFDSLFLVVTAQVVLLDKSMRHFQSNFDDLKGTTQPRHHGGALVG